MVQAVIDDWWASTHTFDEIIDTFSIRKKAKTNNIIAEVDVANADYYFMDQVFETLDHKNVSYIKYGISLNLICSFKRQAYISRSSNRSHYQKRN